MFPLVFTLNMKLGWQYNYLFYYLWCEEYIKLYLSLSILFSILSDQKAALGGTAWAITARVTHHQLRELPAAGLPLWTG